VSPSSSFRVTTIWRLASKTSSKAREGHPLPRAAQLSKLTNSQVHKSYIYLSLINQALNINEAAASPVADQWVNLALSRKGRIRRKPAMILPVLDVLRRMTSAAPTAATCCLLLHGCGQSQAGRQGADLAVDVAPPQNQIKQRASGY
jgi:hypothetical protein